jgi:hypothetical protein
VQLHDCTEFLNNTRARCAFKVYQINDQLSRAANHQPCRIEPTRTPGACLWIPGVAGLNVQAIGRLTTREETPNDVQNDSGPACGARKYLRSSYR